MYMYMYVQIFHNGVQMNAMYYMYRPLEKMDLWATVSSIATCFALAANA